MRLSILAIALVWLGTAHSQGTASNETSLDSSVEHVIELLLVIDQQVLQNFININFYDKDQIKGVVEVEIATAIYGVNQYLKTLMPYGLNIVARKKKLIFTESDAIFKKEHFLKNGTVLDSFKALLEFRRWVLKERVTQELNYDTAILWTGHNLFYKSRSGNDTGKTVSGLNTVSSMCRCDKTVGGIIQSVGGQRLAWQLLKAVIDNMRPSRQQQHCVPKDMTSVETRGFDPDIENRWDLDECSARLIKIYLDQLKASGSNTNCLTETTTNEEPIDITSFYKREVYIIEFICYQAYKYSITHPGYIQEEETRMLNKNNECQAVYCRQFNFKEIPMEGMPCGIKRSRCKRGKCVVE